ncbi:hypothetical protein QTP88_002853 [Uroleucon formosanum]
MSVSKGGRRKINKRPELVAAVAFDLAADNSFIPSTTGGPRSIPTGIIATPVVRPTCQQLYTYGYDYSKPNSQIGIIGEDPYKCLPPFDSGLKRWSYRRTTTIEQLNFLDLGVSCHGVIYIYSLVNITIRNYSMHDVSSLYMI